MKTKYEPREVGEEPVKFKTITYTIPSGATIEVGKSMVAEVPEHGAKYKVVLESNGCNGEDSVLVFGISEDAYKALVMGYYEINKEP